MNRETRQKRYGYDTPLQTRVTKSASDYREVPVTNENEEVDVLLGTIQELTLDNIKKQEEIRYLTDVIAELRHALQNTPDLL